MGSFKHFRYGSGELYEKLSEIEKKLDSVQTGQGTSVNEQNAVDPQGGVTGDDIYRLSEKIRSTLRPPETKGAGLLKGILPGRFARQVIREKVLTDVVRAMMYTDIVLLSMILLSWLGLMQLEPLSSNTDSLFMSVFQGFCALAALMLAFIAFTYVRGERSAGTLFVKSTEDFRNWFRGIHRVNDETEIRICLHLWRSKKADAPDPKHEEIRYESNANILGRALHENDVMSSLPIRTLGVLSSLSVAMFGSLGSLAASSLSSTWTLTVVLWSIFAIAWLLSFTRNVLVEINSSSTEMHMKYAELTPKEIDVISKDVARFTYEDVKSLIREYRREKA